MDIITVGELLIDFIPGDGEGVFVRNAGGAPANVAIAAARNGLDVGMYCKVGNDDFGKFLMQTLEENKVKALSPELCDDATTTMAFVSLSEDNERSFTFARKPGADMMLKASDINEEVIASAKLIAAGSCSLSAGDEVEATEKALKVAKEHDKLIGFDVNYRDLMWNYDREAAVKKVDSILEYVDFLKISEEEEDMVGGRDNIFSKMKEKNIAVTILTLGSEGAECFFDGLSVKVPSFKADKVADTTGAGDAFWGGFLSRILTQGINSVDDLTMDKIENAAKYGNVGGSLAVRTPGAISSLPTRAEIEKFLEENK